MSFKDNIAGIFMVLAGDSELLSLLGVPSSNMEDIKKQIIEERNPGDMVANLKSRLLLYESPSRPTQNPAVERNTVTIDIYVHKDTEKKDRRSSLIAQRVKDLLQGSDAAGVGLYYYGHVGDAPTLNSNWKHAIVIFNYDSVI